jgi:hypothetical protein
MEVDPDWKLWLACDCLSVADNVKGEGQCNGDGGKVTVAVLSRAGGVICSPFRLGVLLRIHALN